MAFGDHRLNMRETPGWAWYNSSEWESSHRPNLFGAIRPIAPVFRRLGQTAERFPPCELSGGAAVTGPLLSGQQIEQGTAGGSGRVLPGAEPQMEKPMAD